MESLSKNKIKTIRALAMKKFRDKEGLFVVEGEKTVNEIIRLYPQLIDCIVTTSDQYSFDGSVYHTDESGMKQISSFKTAPDVLAVVHKPSFKEDLSGLIIALDDIQDPGNLGTIIRTADWFGVRTILCNQHTADVFNPKVIQSTMGAIFRVNVVYCDLKEKLETLNKKKYAAIMNGTDLYRADLVQDAVIIIGNEGNGVSTEIENLSDTGLTIPKFGESESLNAAMACGILLSHFRAQS